MTEVDDVTRRFLESVRTVLPATIAQQLASVQPIPYIDLNALAESPLWRSFVDRHINLKETTE